MNKAEFVDRPAAIRYTKKDANIIINDVFNTIMKALAEGETVQIQGFGTFSVRESAEREAVDYRTKERIVIPGHNAPKFTPGKILRSAVKEGFLRE